MSLEGYNLTDTIAAIATFPSSSALGVIKISGKKAIDIVFRMFVPKKRKNIKRAKSYTLHYGWIVEKTKIKNQKSKIIDEVLVSIMKAPRSYTREDVVEVSSHGGILVLNKILGLVLQDGARMARPGEFSYRAFINGRLDVIQAQAILDIVEAKTESSLFSFSRQLSGEFSMEVSRIKQELRDIVSLSEAFINFPEEDIDLNLKDIKNSLNKVNKIIEGFLCNADTSRILRDGMRCVICGKANVGKSTLFNRFLKEERVIVTHIAGTTRDVIEETINVRGIPLMICDTAGILEPKDLLGKEVMDKTYKKLEESDIVIFVFDCSRPLERKDTLLLEKVKNKNVIFVINKIDLRQKLDIEKLKLFKKPLVKMSALKNIGLSGLEKAIFRSVYKGDFRPHDNIMVLAQWQINFLKSIKTCIGDTLRLVEEGYSIDFLSLSLRPAVEYLGKLCGEIVSEDILDNIFSKFCIGK